MNPRGRWRRRRNLRRVPTTELDRRCEDRKIYRFPYRNRCKSPFLSDFFLKSEPYVHRRARKVLRQKKNTNTHQGKSGRSRARPGPRFGQLNVRYQSQNLSKVVPKTSDGFLLRSQLMGTSGSFGRWHSPQVAPAAQKYNNCVRF